MEVTHWIELGAICLILLVGLAIKNYTYRKLKDIDGYRGIYRRDKDGVLTPTDTDEKGEVTAYEIDKTQ